MLKPELIISSTCILTSSCIIRISFIGKLLTNEMGQMRWADEERQEDGTALHSCSGAQHQVYELIDV